MCNETERRETRLHQQLIHYAEDFARLFQDSEVAERARDILTRQLASYAKDFKSVYDSLNEQFERTRAAHLETIYRLSLASEYRDEATGGHIKRVSRYSALLAKLAGFPDNEVENILHASPMHDIGKVGIPDSVLLKPGRLTEKEFALMKGHTLIGAKILSDSNSDIVQLARTIALNHHERWNGTGYPQGTSGESIPRAAMIVAVVDTFDALTTERPYKAAFSVEFACDVISKEQGQAFDPELAAAFLNSLQDILQIRAEVDESKDTSAAASEFTRSGAEGAAERNASPETQGDYSGRKS